MNDPTVGDVDRPLQQHAALHSKQGAVQFSKAKAYAMRLLAIKARTTRELAERLRAKGYGEEVVQLVLESFKAKRLIDDPAYAKDFVEHRLERGEGPGKIKAELFRRGIEEATVSEMLRQGRAGYDELASARQQAQRHRERLRGLPREARKRRVAHFLQRRGFSPGVVYQIIGRWHEDTLGE